MLQLEIKKLQEEIIIKKLIIIQDLEHGLEQNGINISQEIELEKLRKALFKEQKQELMLQ